MPQSADTYIDLKGRKPNIFRRVLVNRPPSSKRRNVSSTALAREPINNTSVAPNAAVTASTATPDAREPIRWSDSEEGTRPLPAGQNAQRYYLTKGNRNFATFEAKDVVSTNEQPLPTSGQSSPRKKPSNSTRLPQRAAENTSRVGTDGGQADRPVTHAAAPNPIFQSMLEEAELPSNVLTSQSNEPRQRGVPKPPALRMKDKLKSPSPATAEEMDVDGADEAGYIYETYVLDAEAVDFDFATAAPGTVGILMIDEEDKPRWEAYLDWEEPDSDEFQNSDDEDENAENYYAADYPEDEVDTDDEHDVDPYKYSNRDGSDDDDNGDERYPSDDGGAHSGDDDEDYRNHSHPWTRHWNRG